MLKTQRGLLCRPLWTPPWLWGMREARGVAGTVDGLEALRQGSALVERGLAIERAFEA
jgi:hypothetical protein